MLFSSNGTLPLIKVKKQETTLFHLFFQETSFCDNIIKIFIKM